MKSHRKKTHFHKEEQLNLVEFTNISCQGIMALILKLEKHIYTQTN